VLETSCQLLFLERGERGARVDLVTVEPTTAAGTVVPAGTTVAVGVALDGSAPGAFSALRLLEQWADEIAVLRFGIVEGDESVELVFERADQRLVLEAARRD
jgi:hypothetical protein